MIRMTNPEGITVTYEYDSLGRKSRIYNRSGMEVRYEYDCLDRLEQITYGNGIVTRYQYDDSGNISQLETKAGDKICCLSGMSMMGMGTEPQRLENRSWQAVKVAISLSLIIMISGGSCWRKIGMGMHVVTRMMRPGTGSRKQVRRS